MSEKTEAYSRADRADRAITAASGWAALALAIFSHLRSVAMNTPPWGEWWARASLIMAAGLGIMWLWGYWPDIWPRVRGWVRHGGLNSALVAIGLVVALIIVNTLVRRRVEVKFDLTKNQRFTLAPRTREILKGLKDPITVTFFAPKGGSPSANVERGKDLFKQYADASDKIKWTVVDPLTNQEVLLAKKPEKMTTSDLTSAILEMGQNRQEITDYTEKDITSAILKLTRPTDRKIAFLQGHGEASPEAGANPTKPVQVLTQDLQGLNWRLESVNLYGKAAKALHPDEAAVLVIAGPERELAPDEGKRVNDYLNEGGKVLLLLGQRSPSYAKFLAPWGIRTANDLVLDPRGGLLVATADSGAHLAVRPLQGGKRVAFPPMRSVSSISPAPAGVSVTELLKTTPTAIKIDNFDPKKTDLQAAAAAAKPGQVPIAALAEKKLKDDKTARLIVVGDTTFATDTLAQLPTIFNKDLISGLVNYLGEDEALVAIPPKDENTEQAFLMPEQLALFGWIHLGYFPILALALAILVYLKRR